MQTTPGTSLSDDTATNPVARSRQRGIAQCALVALVALTLDQSTKWWAERALDDAAPRELLGGLLQLRLTYNPGAAFSVGTGYTIVLTCIALAVIAVVVSMARRIRSAWWAVALGLLLGGALGNVTDRLLRPPAPFRGHVVDFLELPNWPVFNVADSAITVAAVLFVGLSLLGVHLDGTRESRRTTADGDSRELADARAAAPVDPAPAGKDTTDESSADPTSVDGGDADGAAEPVDDSRR